MLHHIEALQLTRFVFIGDLQNVEVVVFVALFELAHANNGATTLVEGTLKFVSRVGNATLEPVFFDSADATFQDGTLAKFVEVSKNLFCLTFHFIGKFFNEP